MSKNRSRSPSGDHSESTILKISNHASASEAGIRAFFKGLEVDSVCQHEGGVCHVKFANLKAANAAMAFDGKILNESAV
jgi:hypothetical protein